MECKKTTLEVKREIQETVASSRIHWKDYLRDKKYAPDINSMCEKCRSDQMKESGKITIKCDGLASIDSLVDKSMQPHFTQEELKSFSELADPYEWALSNVPGVQMRWYQEMMTRCLTANTDVFLGDGTIKKIKDVAPGERVLSYNEKRRDFPKNYRTTTKWNNGVKPVYRISLENGDKLEVTDNHPILSHCKVGLENQLHRCPSYKTDYVTLKEGLSVGDKVYTMNRFNQYGDVDNDSLAKILGYLATDGYVDISRGKVSFSNIREEYVLELKEAIEDEFGNIVTVSKTDSHVTSEGSLKQDTWNLYVRRRDDGVHQFLEGIGAVDKHTREVRMLDFAFKLSLKSLRVFINRCWSGDGCIYNIWNEDLGRFVSSLSLHSGNEEFLDRYRLLLKKIGIITSHIYKERTSGLGLRLVVRQTVDIDRFFKEVGLIYGKERQSDTARLSAERQIGLGTKYRKKGRFRSSSRTKIVSIEYVGEKEVFDIEVDTRHNFVANGIVVHNCTAKRRTYRCGRRSGKTYALALNIAHRILTHEYYKVLIATPYELQAEELVNSVRELIQRLDSNYGEYKDLVIRDVKSPSIFMSISNGSRLRALTTGSSGAGTVRGQAADLIILDEVDYMSDSDIDSIAAILADTPDTEMWMASTPTGKKSRFYDRCHDVKYKEFHFPSYVLPHYNDDIDDEFRDTLTEIGYVHEVLAEFGESENGVFQKSLIAQALTDVTSQDEVMLNRKDYILALGCDWNGDKVGTRLQVVAFSKRRKKFSVVTRVTVSKEGWTQVAAVQSIIDLNRIWKLDYLYVDEGFGVSTVQFIKKFAYDQFGKLPEGHPDLNLANIVGINFGSKIEVRDVITSQTVKKDMKVYMVDNVVRMLEKGAIELDRVADGELRKQLENYIILRKSPTGRPVYGCDESRIGDHDLDAFMLAMLSFAMELSSFVGDPEFAPIIGEVAEIITEVDPDAESEEDLVSKNMAIGLFAKRGANKMKSFYRSNLNHAGRSEISTQIGGKTSSNSTTIGGGRKNTSNGKTKRGRNTTGRRASF